jgi:hypothetical protein
LILTLENWKTSAGQPEFVNGTHYGNTPKTALPQPPVFAELGVGMDDTKRVCGTHLTWFAKKRERAY